MQAEGFGMPWHHFREVEKKVEEFLLAARRFRAFAADALILRNPRRTPRVWKLGVFSIHWYKECLSVVTFAATTVIIAFRIRTVQTFLCEISRFNWCIPTPVFGAATVYVDTICPVWHFTVVSNKSAKLLGFTVSVSV